MAIRRGHPGAHPSLVAAEVTRLKLLRPKTVRASSRRLLPVETCLHAVERIPSAGRGQPAQFVPIRFIHRNKLTKDDKLLLAFDAFVLSEMLGRTVSLGKIIHGDDRDCARSSRGNEAQISSPVPET